MRMNGTTKSFVANHIAETTAGVVTIRAFEEEDRFFEKNLDLIDINASPFFHSFASNEWLIQRLEIISAILLSSTALCMVMLPPGTFSSGETLVIITCEISWFGAFQLTSNYFLLSSKGSIMSLDACFLIFNIRCSRIHWHGSLLWSFTKCSASIFNSKSMQSCKLHNLCREAKSIYAYTK